MMDPGPSRWVWLWIEGKAGANSEIGKKQSKSDGLHGKLLEDALIEWTDHAPAPLNLP
jgi:hypothetical protein